MDQALDDYIKESRVDEVLGDDEELDAKPDTERSFADPPKISVCGRFDRKSLRENSDDSDDEEIGSKLRHVASDETVGGLSFKSVRFDEDEEEDELRGLSRFSTAESRQGVRVRSQQFRLFPENLVDRPEGVKRLEVMPLDDAERYRRVRHGRVNKSRGNSQQSSFANSRASSMASLCNRQSVAMIGTFVEKGKFTYKFGDRNNNGVEGVIGIERAKRLPVEKDPHDAPTQAGPAAAPQININMNWGGFYEGFTNAIDTIPKPSPVPRGSQPSAGDGLADAAMKLLQMLQAKKQGQVLSTPRFSADGAGSGFSF